MSDTPRTDVFAKALFDISGALDEAETRASLVDFARQLELDNAELLKALSSASGYLRNALIDLDTNTPKATTRQTIEGGLTMVSAAITKAKS